MIKIITQMKIGIVGCGVMGTSIAQLVAQAEIDVILFNRNDGTYKAKEKIFKTIDMLASKGKILDASLIKKHVSTAESLNELSGCSIIIEAIPENFKNKVALFHQIEEVVSPDCIIVSNTSSLSITALSAKLLFPKRVAGLHFFNPAPLMKIVEIVTSSFSDDDTISKLTDFIKLLGHESIQTKDTPGFVINHVGRGYVTEAMHILTENVTSFHEIDKILRDTAKFKMGPCELLDLTALDVSHPVMESIYEQFYHDPRYKPQPITRQMLAAGHVGRKVGKGFYTYDDGIQEIFPEQYFEHISEPKLYINDKNVELLLERQGIQVQVTPNYDNADAILMSSLGTDLTTEVTMRKVDACRSIAIDIVGNMDVRVVLMTTLKTSPYSIAAAVSAFKKANKKVSVIRDSSGYITQRVLAVIINIASEIAQQGIATPEDIDKAIKLGLGYPKGPLEWGDEIGSETILEILTNLQQQTGSDRYRPSPWLRRRAKLGLSLLSKELCYGSIHL